MIFVPIAQKVVAFGINQKLPTMKLVPKLVALFLLVCCLSCSIEREPSYTVSNDTTSVDVYSYEQFKSFLEAPNDTTYVVNFWATWCKPCVAELPYFEQLYQKYKDRNVRLILVSLDFEKELEKKLLPFIEKNELQGEVIVLQQKGMNDWIDKIDSTWSGSLPATIIYNQEKRKRRFYEQSFHYEDLEAALKEVL